MKPKDIVLNKNRLCSSAGNSSVNRPIIKMQKTTGYTSIHNRSRLLSNASKLKGLHALPPRERLLHEGPESLSDIELLAILLSTGTKEMNVVAWSQFLLTQFRGIHGLIHASTESLLSAKGIGPAKFAIVKALGELAKRYMMTEWEHGDSMNDPKTAQNFAKMLLSKEESESFLVLFLDNQHRLISHKIMFKGGLSSVAVYPREIVRESLKRHASAIIIAHNHPSGILSPSQEDLQLTDNIKQACIICDIHLLDHILVAKQLTLSFKLCGLL